MTLENALGNVAQSLKDAGRRGMGNFGNYSQNPGEPYGPGNGYSTKYSYRPFGRSRTRDRYDSSSKRMKEAREEFALFVNTGWARAMGILFTTLGIALTLMFGITAGSLGIASMFIDSLAAKDGYGADDLSSGHGYQSYYGCLGQLHEKEDQKVPVLCEDTERETLRNH